MRLRVEIDTDECMSAGRCVSDAPEAFGLEGELAVVLDGVGELSEMRLRRIARNCPGQAVLLFDEHGERVDP